LAQRQVKDILTCPNFAHFAYPQPCWRAASARDTFFGHYFHAKRAKHAKLKILSIKTLLLAVFAPFAGNILFRSAIPAKNAKHAKQILFKDPFSWRPLRALREIFFPVTFSRQER